MENAFILITLAGVAAIGILSPGPDFLAVTHAAVTSSRKQAAAVAAGVVLGNGIWASAALFGVGALFLLFPTFFAVFKICGGLYFIWLGTKILRGARKPIDENIGRLVVGYYKGFSKGLTTTMANPKAAIYYASALVAVTPPDASMLLLGSMVSVVLIVATIWFSCVVIFLSTPKVSGLYKKAKVYLESVFGSLILMFGIKQLLSK